MSIALLQAVLLFNDRPAQRVFFATPFQYLLTVLSFNHACSIYFPFEIKSYRSLRKKNANRAVE